MNKRSETDQKMIDALEAAGEFRVLDRFRAPAGYAPIDLLHGPIKLAMVIDTETTSLDYKTGKIIEIGYLMVEFDSVSGVFHNIVGRYSGFQDPCEPLSEETKLVTGITDADVAGKSFDRERIEADIASASVCVAHNAPFDRNYLEKYFPSMVNKWWICSQREGVWKQMGIGSVKLEFLAFAVAGVFYEAHRALVDAEVTLHVLAQKSHDDRTVFAHALESARKQTYRLWATGSSFETKDILKKRGYKWADGTDPEYPIKAWYKDGVTDLDAEKSWLFTDIYGWFVTWVATAQDHRVLAMGAPLSKKAILEKRGYAMGSGADDCPANAWCKDGIVDPAAEKLWLLLNVYGDAAKATIMVDTITGRERYTSRFLARDKQKIAPVEAAPPLPVQQQLID